jgi:hypothetical protein
VPDIDLTALLKSLYARRKEAVVVPYEPRTMTSGPPTERDCHNNVDRWVLEQPDHKSVRGWLVFDRTGDEIARRILSLALPRPVSLCRFTAHSVVEAPGGRLFDLTPSNVSQRYPFLRHQGPDGEFRAIVLAGHSDLDLHPWTIGGETAQL